MLTFSEQMKRPLGQTGMVVSPLGLGTVKFGRNTDVKYPQAFDLPDDKTLADLLSLTRDLGINLLDTAPAYGSSEGRLGRLLKGQRRDWLISTKVGETYIDGHSAYQFSSRDTVTSIENSLQQLATDYLDIVLIHSDGRDTYIVEETDVIETLSRLKERGLIRSYGLSGKTLEGGLAALRQSDLAMVTYNRSYEDEAPIIDVARESGKGLLVKKALNSGQADDPKASIQFVMANQGVSSLIMGTINPTHLINNVKWSIEVLSQLS